MNNSDFSVAYPAVHPGTEKTSVFLFKGTPDLTSVFSGSGSESPRRLFVTDTVITGLPAIQPFLGQFNKGICDRDILLILDSGEPNKTIETVLTIIKTAIENNFTRRDIFTGIGGGVVCDMTAFAASIYKRGAVVELVPTTLLAMVDAAIGGKAGCDFDEYKNMIGTFFPAEKLYVFSQFVQSLPDDQYRSGMAEVVKTALLYSRDLYTELEHNRKKIMNRDEKMIDMVIKTCIQAKATVVEQDFTEKNVRMQLNYGHTFGHALETVAGLGSINHGDAVAWGISRALALAARLGICKPHYRDSITGLLSSFGWDTAPVPEVLSCTVSPAEKLLSAMKKDKKNAGNHVRVILQKGLTENIIMEADDADILAVLTTESAL